jgi:hypothetical protein
MEWGEANIFNHLNTIYFKTIYFLVTKPDTHIDGNRWDFEWVDLTVDEESELRGRFFSLCVISLMPVPCGTIVVDFIRLAQKGSELVWEELRIRGHYMKLYG